MAEIIKVYHIADVHIRNLQLMKEYRDRLDDFKTKLLEDIGDTPRESVRIAICGDIVHNKTQISNELIAFVSSWIRELEEIAKVIVISGNHDVMIGNTQRMDTLSAIFTASQFKNAIHLDGYFGYDSGIYVDNNITWALYSIFTDFKRPDIEKVRKDYPNNTVIGLFHGPICGSSLSNGTKMETGISTDIFDGCDFVMAGDIHKRQMIKYKDTRIVYPGSLIQQNTGETITEHGFAVWNIPKKSYEFIDLPLDYELFNYEIKTPEDLDNDKEILINL